MKLSDNSVKLNQWLPIGVQNIINIQKIHWDQFTGNVQQQKPYYAHIYWNIKYQYTKNNDKVTPKLKVNISKNSWVKHQYASQQLRNHEQGHYLIGCICAMQFGSKIRKLNGKLQKLDEQIKRLFKQTILKYLQIQRIYDEETEHMLNSEGQNYWDGCIFQMLNQYISKLF